MPVPIEAARARGRAFLYTSLVALLVIAAATAWHSYTVRSSVRWFLHANKYKAYVLAQPGISGQLKHVEWDGWGGFPVGDWTVYVVSDPTDSLSASVGQHLTGKISGIPCDVDEVRRLENHWYSVTLAMNEWWEQCK